eukprot:g31674.t1
MAEEICALCMEYYLDGGRKALEYKEGHVGFFRATTNQKWSLSYAAPLQEFTAFKSVVEACLRSHRQQLASLQKQYPVLSYFTPSQHLSLLELLDSAASDPPSSAKAKAVQVWHYLAFARPSLSFTHVQQSLGWWREARPGAVAPAAERDPAVALDDLAVYLTRTLHREAPPRAVPKMPNLYLVPDHSLFDAVLGIYVEKDRLPKPSEVMFCSQLVTPADASAFLSRCWRAARLGNRLHTLVEVERLLPHTQNQLLAELRTILELQQVPFALAFVSGKSSADRLAFESPVFQFLRQQKLERVCHELKPEVRWEIYQSLWNVDIKQPFQHDTPFVHSFVSDRAGQGKTHRIHELAEQHCEGRRVSVPISGMADRKIPYMLERLSQRPATVGQRVVIHLTVQADADDSINRLLFQLLVLGHLHSSQSLAAYHVLPADAFLIELPRNISMFTDSRPEELFVFPWSLPMQEVTMQSNPLKIRAQERLVFSYLRALRAANGNGRGFAPEPTQDVTNAEAHTLLQHFFLKGHHSMVLVQSFLKYMANQLRHLRKMLPQVTLQEQELGHQLPLHWKIATSILLSAQDFFAPTVTSSSVKTTSLPNPLRYRTSGRI